MIRITILQAISYLVDTFVKVNTSASKKDVNSYKSKLEGFNPIDLGAELKYVSNGLMGLKGTREATNISFAPNDSQTTYKEAESLVGSIGTFVGKNGLKYECGVYCKKVVIKKDTKKK